MSERPRFRAHLATAEALGHPVRPGASILDLGCRGDRVLRDLLEAGFDAYGCDFVVEGAPESERFGATGRYRQIERAPYRLPFDDKSFDFVLSNQVFEHVQNYAETIREIARVLRPTGASLHVFPSRYAPIEPHVHVPLATIIRSRAWLALWAHLGVRNQFQRGMVSGEVARRNREYLVTRTNYLTKSAIEHSFRAHFETVRFCLEFYFRYYPDKRVQRIYRVLHALPWGMSLAETFSTRVVFVSGPLAD